MDLLEKVRALLVDEFPPPDKIELDDDHGIIGAVVSQRFEGLESIDRINIIWDLLDRNLNKEERRQIVTIVAVTPVEEIAHLA
jgi:stress-induced morphogen